MSKHQFARKMVLSCQILAKNRHQLMRTIVLQTLESEQASATHEKDSVLIANPSDEREQNEQVQMVTGVIERVWIPIAYRYLQRSNQILYWIIQTQSTQDSLITTERADMAVKAIDDVNPIEINTVEQDTNSNVCEAIECCRK